MNEKCLQILGYILQNNFKNTSRISNFYKAPDPNSLA